MVEWDSVAHEFIADDGSLCDLYVFEVSEREWDRFLAELPLWGYAIAFSIDGESAPFPLDAREAFEIAQRATPLLAVKVGTVVLQCHFFVAGEIELDLRPEDIDGPANFNALLGFMRRLGSCLGRPVVITPENASGAHILRYCPVMDRVSYRDCDRR